MIGGNEADAPTVTGTGVPGTEVTVKVNDKTVTTTVQGDGTWTADFDPDDLPIDCQWQAEVTAKDSDGNDVVLDGPTMDIDTTPPPVAVTGGAETNGDFINADGHPGGATISGTSEAGATVEVTIDGTTHSTTVAADGTWSVTFTSTEITTGEYKENISVTATDARGNAKTITETLVVDTEQAVTINASVNGDYVINAAEQAAGVTFTGTAQAGSSVVVTLGSASTTVQADSSGNWSASFSASEIATGTYATTVSATATDAYGNTATADAPIQVDTEIGVSINSPQAGGDDIVSGVEANGDLILTGAAEPGASVAVSIDGVMRKATVAADGTWAATFEAGSIAEGEYDATITAEAVDAAGNKASATAALRVDTTTTVDIDSGQAGGDDIINGAEHGAAITLTGTAEPGASVAVTVEGVTRQATVDANGNWSAVYEPGSIPAGEYNTTITAVATDAVGNQATSTAAIRIDTVAGDVALSSQPIEIYDVINAVERADGVEISGTATPGLTVTVTLGTTQTAVVADANGNWSTTFPASDVPTGTDTLPISASITDDVGNSKTVTDTVNLDTEVVPFNISDAPVEGDDIINAVERADGVTLNGAVEPVSAVSVMMGATTVAATVDQFGNWQATFLPGQIPEGTYTADIEVTATDLAGNVRTLTDKVLVDTEAGLAVDPNQTADDVINAAEHAQGVTLGGTTDPGSTVTVELQGVIRSAVVDGNGNWEVTFDPSDLPEGTYTATANITAVDLAGNTATVSESFMVDTQVDTPGVDAVTFSGDDVRRISTEDAQDSYQVNTLEAAGAVGAPAAIVDQDPTFGTEFTFGTPISDGTNLVITRTDDAGNSASTVVVLEDDATTGSTIGHAGVSNFDVAALDLEYSEDANLVLTEAQIKALSDGTNTLTIHGGMDDTVTVAGATDTGTTQTIGGQTYNVYTIGNDGATLVIEQDVNVII